MARPAAPPRAADAWAGPAAGADELDQLVYLSHLIGREPGLVQPGGGNTSIKLGDVLLVKGGGTDLRTIGREGFARLSLAELAALRSAEAMSDADMMRFMARCMVPPDGRGPAPSVETPLHSLLPHRVIAHTHDVATMSLTNLSDPTAERLVTELFRGEIVYVPYVRPGFPLARLVGGMVDRLPRSAVGLALAHHGLVVWGEDAQECYARLVGVVSRIDEYLETRRRGRAVLGATPRRPRGATAGRLGQGRARSGARHYHRVPRQTRRRHGQPVLSGGARDDRECGSARRVRVHSRGRGVRLRALAARATEDCRTGRARAHLPARPAPSRGPDRRRQRHRAGGGAAVRGGRGARRSRRSRPRRRGCRGAGDRGGAPRSRRRHAGGRPGRREPGAAHTADGGRARG